MGVRAPAHTVVVGGGIAGLRVVQGLRRAGYGGRLTLVGAEAQLPYDRPPLSKQVLLGEWDRDRTALTTEAVLAGLDVTWRPGERAVALDGRRLLLDRGAALEWDAVVVATGSEPHRHPFAHDGVAGVHDLRSIEDAEAVAAAFAAGARVAVVGAGFIGTEVASAAVQRGLPVTLIDAAERPLAAHLGRTGASTVLAWHRERGVTLRFGRKVARVHGTGRVAALELDDGSRVDADIVVVGVGVRAATGWLGDLGRRGVVVDATGAATVPGVWAVGDAAAWPTAAGQAADPAGHWTRTVAQAATVAANLVRAPGERQPLVDVPYVWTDQYGVRVQQLGRVTDHEQLLDGDVAAGRFALTWTEDGRVVGGLAVGRPSALPLLRRAVQDRAVPAELALPR